MIAIRTISETPSGIKPVILPTTGNNSDLKTRFLIKLPFDVTELAAVDIPSEIESQGPYPLISQMIYVALELEPGNRCGNTTVNMKMKIPISNKGFAMAHTRPSEDPRNLSRTVIWNR